MFKKTIALLEHEICGCQDIVDDETGVVGQGSKEIMVARIEDYKLAIAALKAAQPTTNGSTPSLCGCSGQILCLRCHRPVNGVHA